MKLIHPTHIILIYPVAPRLVAWIEITAIISPSSKPPIVAPRVGAWIEIQGDNMRGSGGSVAPRVGAWIEI